MAGYLVEPQILQGAQVCLNSIIDACPLWTHKVNNQPPLSWLAGLWDYTHWAQLLLQVLADDLHIVQR